CVRFLSPTLVLSAALLFVLGCGGESGPQCQPVEGRILYQNQPLAEAIVVFHPLTPPLEKVPQPIGNTNAEGRFVMTTLKSGDGAPEGEYAITVELREPRQIGEEVVRDGPNLLPRQYASPKETPLRHKVVPGKNAVPEIKL
ncbi:MAG: hypothetical protein IAF94_14425, partial [Pirellulaceae bacterium]|nr:hypothetical protein [Pirellulaceae bacterium]